MLVEDFNAYRMSLFLDYLWIWIVLTFVAGICGYAWHVNSQTRRTFISAIVLPILTLALGLTLYYGVDTDRKSIVRMLDALIAAVEEDDAEKVCEFISPKAEKIQHFAKTQMGSANVSQGKYHSLNFKINDAAQPPIADVRFTAIFYWTTKTSYEGFSNDRPIPETVRFEVQLVKTKSPSKSHSWIITGIMQVDSRFFRNLQIGGN